MLPDATALRERAGRLRGVAADVRRILDDAVAVRHLAGRVTWEGPAADHFSTVLGVQIRAIDHLVDQLRHAAHRLDALADAVAIG